MRQRQQIEKWLAVIAFLMAALVIYLWLLRTTQCEQLAMAEQAPTMVPVPTSKTPWLSTEANPDDGCSCVECAWMPCHEPTDEGDVPEWEMNREEAISQIVLYWNIFFDDEDAPINDPRRKRFERYAGYVHDAVRYYQENETDIGGRMPRHRSSFELVAAIITFESSVRPEVVGPEPRCEVGLMQVHGKALAGYKRDDVKSNPRLGVNLGVRWLASRINVCYPDGIDDHDWSDMDWLGPMSVYAAGGNGMTKDRCLKLSVARERVHRMIEYRQRIEYDL